PRSTMPTSSAASVVYIRQLVGDYRLEVEQDEVLQEVVDNLIDELGSNKELTDWVVDFAKENLENERAWDVRYSLIEFSKEIFREEFKHIEDDVNRVAGQKGFFKNLKNTLWAIKGKFFAEVSTPAQEALKIIESNGWSVEDFSYGKNSGLLTFFKTFAFEKNISKIKSPGERIRNHFTQPQKWPSKTTRHNATIQRVAGDKLVPLLETILDVYDTSIKQALSAEVALKNLYVFGLITDISRKLKEYKDENNLMLLADAPKFLNGVIQDSDTPFIYEKVGSFYRNYLIDEFQDTSGMQWKNFQPLIVNSLDQGHTSLVVGDVKQAIYRWRGGDLNLLQQEIVPLIGDARVKVENLDTNYRSASEVINFNNAVFKTASTLLSQQTLTDITQKAYLDVAQAVARKNEKGFVQVEFIQEEKEENGDAMNFRPGNEDESTTAARWTEIALQRMTFALEQLQLKGAALRDIAILVRKNDEGQRIAAHLLNFKNSEDARKDCRYDVVSNESLRIDGASSVNLLLGAMYYLLNGEDAIARAQLAYEYARLHEPSRVFSDVFTITNQTIFENNLPEEFTKQKNLLRKLGILELTETLIKIFKLQDIEGELVYLQTFQNLVLDFYNRERNDLGSFLEWWEDNKHKKSIQISGEVDAIQILTVHKSKGLQFKYVIIPFCSWGLDHDNWQAPNLWVRSKESPFNEAGYIPVKYSKNLEETYFADYYTEEKTRTYLDNLNLLYVALTRAEVGMFITAPAPEVRSSKDSVASVLYHCLNHGDTLRPQWNEETLTWTSGEWMLQPSVSKSDSNAIQLSRYFTFDWRNNLIIKRSGSEFFNGSIEDQREKINYGIHIHEVLSRVQYEEDVADVLDEITIEGIISLQEKAIVEEELKSLFSIPQIKDWFSKDWSVKTEVPILLPDGDENRVDRLLIKDKTAVIIDFKTGTPKKSDNAQVQQYIDILRQMNYTKIEGYLLYVRDKEIVEVKSEGKQKLIRKKNDRDQLSLGF
ncbi:UvrD-helicase domain-containing protein, partial [Chryseosolibacter indicus]